MHKSQDVAAGDENEVPAQGVHDELSSAAANLPLGQSTQDMEAGFP